MPINLINQKMTKQKIIKKKIVVPLLPSSLNKYLRMHWASRAKELEDWKYYIQNEWNKDKNLKLKPPIVVTIHYYFKDNKRRDFDNYSGKVVLDAIKGRYIDDDSANKNISELRLRFSFGDSNPRTEILLEELDSDTSN